MKYLPMRAVRNRQSSERGCATLLACIGLNVDQAREKQLQEMELLSGDMLRACERQEWEAVAGIEKQRNRLLKHFFATSPNASESDRIVATVRNIQSIDQQVIALCKSQKQDVAKKLGDLKKGKKIEATYQKY